MGQITCKYHPDTPARWVCRSCHINFCASCVTRTHPSAHPLCPVCRQEVDSLGVGNVITPFWRRIPRFFAYPAQPSALMYLMALSVISVMVALIPLGFLIELLVLIAFVKYAYVVLEHTARGHLEPPEFSGGTLFDELVLPFKQVMLLFCFSFANFAVYDLLGSFASDVFYVLITVALPASTMVLAVEYSFFAALNPLILGSMIRRIGLPYFVLFLFLFALSTGGQWAMGMLPNWLPALFYVPLGNLVLMYFSLIMFTMMGYVIFQYHEELGYSIDVEPEAKAAGPAASEPVNPALQEVEILIKEGRFDEALRSLDAKVKASPADWALRERYHRLLVTTQDKERLAAHCPDFISRLVSDKRVPRALEVYADCVRFDPACKPANPNHVHELAAQLNARGQAKLALALLNNFHVAFPSHQDIARNYLLAAQIMSEKLNQDDNAKKLLSYLLEKYPDHPLGPEIRAYLDVLQKVSSG
ncbi:MAG: hypothetical protein P8009_03965 [Gammaproteobacteria bacterium]